MFLFFRLYHSMNSGNFYCSEIRHGIFSRGRHFLIWPIRIWAAEQGTVFKVLIWFWVLNRVYNFTIKRLELGVFLDWKLFKECEDLRWAVYICSSNIFFLNIYFHDFSVKNYLILYAKQTNQGQKVVFPVLNRVAKWAIFVLNRVGVWRPQRHTPSQTSLECPPRNFFEVKFWSRDFLGFWLKP